VVQLNTALAYLKHGWSIIPVHSIINGQCSCGKEDCAAPGKHPYIRWAEYTKRRPTKEEVKNWFDNEFLGANIGLVTGTVSGVLVVDCDGREGVKSAKEILDLPFPTLVSLTGGGGFHVFYKVNGTRVASKLGVCEKVDLKAEHGFVVLPPSRHISGYNYKWFHKAEPAEIDLSQFEAEEQHVEVVDKGWFTELLAGVDEGDRGNSAARLAGRYASMGVDLNFLWLGMKGWNQRNRPPLPESELKTTVKSIYHKHQTETRPQEIKNIDEIIGMFKDMKGR
jgi:hypothetical protein